MCAWVGYSCHPGIGPADPGPGPAHDCAPAGMTRKGPLVSAVSGLQALAQGAILLPFTRARRLFESVAPGHAKPIELTVGDPREVMPAFVTEKLAEARTELSSYPKIRGSDELRGAIANWIGRRYGLAGVVDATREILPVNGSREALYFAALPAVGRR